MKLWGRLTTVAPQTLYFLPLSPVKKSLKPALVHTAGPWFIGEKCPLASKDGRRTEFYVYAEHGNIAKIPTDVVGHLHREAEANARLIAAAPELLAAARDNIDLLPLNARTKKLYDAISKAEGR